MAKQMLVMALGLTLLVPAFGQQSGSPLPPEDPRLYLLFFQFHDKVSSAIQSKKTQDSVAGGKAEQAFAQKLRVKQQDLQKVTNISHQFVTDLGKWEEDLRSFVERIRSQKQEPDGASLAQFDLRKRQLIDSAVHQMSTTLSAASWTGLHGYINDEHRLHTSVVEVKSATPK